MARISLENMRFHAHHGLYEEETLIGNNFILDIMIDANTDGASVIQQDNTPKVVNTINYEWVYEVCRTEMSKPQLLLETVIKRIVAGLKTHFPNMHTVQIKIKKLNPPLGGVIESVSITDIENFLIQCGKCKKAMICYNDNTCWCKEEGLKNRIHPRTAELIGQQYKGCLCRACLKSMEG